MPTTNPNGARSSSLIGSFADEINVPPRPFTLAELPYSPPLLAYLPTHSQFVVILTRVLTPNLASFLSVHGNMTDLLIFCQLRGRHPSTLRSSRIYRCPKPYRIIKHAQRDTLVVINHAAVSGFPPSH